MKRISLVLTVVLAAAALAPQAAASEATKSSTAEQLLGELQARFSSPGSLAIEQAAAVLVDRANGQPVPGALAFEAAKTVRDVAEGPDAAKAALTAALYERALSAHLAGIGEQMAADRDALAAATVAGAFAQAEPALAVMEEIGLAADQVRAHADLLAAIGDTSVEAVVAVADAIALGTQQDVWGQELWDAYGLVLTVAWLMVAEQVPAAAPWILPHNFRLAAFHFDLAFDWGWDYGVDYINFFGFKIPDPWVQVWLTFDIDLLGALAFDLHGVTDALALQLPLGLALDFKCSLWRGCSLLFDLTEHVIAREAHFIFAYPANAGQLATRGTAMDLLQSVYDRIGTLHFQAPRDPLADSPAALSAPGPADLATQAPPVNYIGLQAQPDAPALDESVRTRLRDPIDIEVMPGVAMPASNTGVTAGFIATEVRAWRINILISRWHNLGAETAGVAASAPASFYYDVPEGLYRITNTRVDEYGPAVYYSDWRIAGGMPSL